MTSGKDSISYFNQIAESWQRFSTVDPAAAAATVDALRVPPGGRLLDVGCGTGPLFGPLLERLGGDGSCGQGLLVGLDPARRMLAVAKRTHRDPRLRLVCATIEEYDGGDGPFDSILVSRVLHHLEDPAAAMTRLTGWLRPGGRLVVLDTREIGTTQEGGSDSCERALSVPGLVCCTESHGNGWSVWVMTKPGDNEKSDTAAER